MVVGEVYWEVKSKLGEVRLQSDRGRVEKVYSCRHLVYMVKGQVIKSWLSCKREHMGVGRTGMDRWKGEDQFS